MRLRYFLTNQYEQLRADIGDNLSKYISETPWIESCFDENFDAEAPVEVFLPKLISSPKPAVDIDNVKLLYNALINLTPEQATDGRLWAHLSHVEYWEYMRARWDVDRKDIAEEDTAQAKDRNSNLARQIKDRYFLASDENSRSLIRNGISRLWWFGYLTYDRHNSEDPFALTKTLLDYQDTQAALLERTFGKNPEVLKVCLKVLTEYMPLIRQSGGRSVIQGLGKYINLLGGTYFLDTMDKSVFEEKVTAFVRRKLQG